MIATQMLPGLSACTRCERLHQFMAQLKPKKGFSSQDYWNRPVPGFGPSDAQVWLVGLAPGAHGANRTGRPFTGDGAGDFMYPLLHQAGFCSAVGAEIAADDGLELHNLYISNAVKCLPPGNKPIAAEFAACRSWLRQEWSALKEVKVIVALGRDAFTSLLHFFKELGLVQRLADYPFVHGEAYLIGASQWLVPCYHTSRYNVQTGRITAPMFLDLTSRVHELIHSDE
ncbi:MAG: uracil-DNA glycosylase [Desulfuromonadaceae bacterium]|nr:uracil-DNA glycosylase [Desulfuromonas sp.]MDY0184778.1 uracil-DNA glycosylase [Desulfuromonadaceae bacterium]